ncbi:MAG: response regulator transcription factor [Proteobacteria bacterium]|nr:response regulator transcription factor [Pseudomonadota bacterium]
MKILLVDDEPLARDRLLRLLKKVQPDAEILQAASGAAALKIVRKATPDLIFLDIRMPGMDGIEVATQLDTLEQAPAVIFSTAYDEYALEALKHQAVAYLLKPVREAELVRALDGAGRVNRLQLANLRGAGPARTQVSSQTHRGLETLPLGEIECFLAEDKYVSAYTNTECLLIPDTLKDLESEFSDDFVRVHRNALVSLAHIVRLCRADDGSWTVALSGVELSPAVSRRHLAETKARLKRR